MQIDWITVAAQVVNFLVLVWLLQRFLYGPVTRAMKRREERIESRLQKAEMKRKEAQEEAETLRRKQRDLDQRREEMLESAHAEAKRTRKRLEREAREAVEQERESWRRDLDAEKEAFLRELRSRSARHVAEVARAALKDLADAELEAQAAARFLVKLNSLGDGEIDRLKGAADDTEDPLRIESAFPLSSSVKEQITKTLHKRFAETRDVDYLRDEELVFGIRLRVGARVIEWSINSYLDRLEEAAGQILSKASPEDARDAA